MKEKKHIVLRFLLLVLLLCSLGLEISFHHTANYHASECSSEAKSMNNVDESFIDSFNDDHINQLFEPAIIIEQQSFIPHSNDLILRHIISVSYWQPPREINLAI